MSTAISELKQCGHIDIQGSHGIMHPVVQVFNGPETNMYVLLDGSRSQRVSPLHSTPGSKSPFSLFFLSLGRWINSSHTPCCLIIGLEKNKRSHKIKPWKPSGKNKFPLPKIFLEITFLKNLMSNIWKSFNICVFYFILASVRKTIKVLLF